MRVWARQQGPEAEGKQWATKTATAEVTKVEVAELVELEEFAGSVETAFGDVAGSGAAIPLNKSERHVEVERHAPKPKLRKLFNALAKKLEVTVVLGPPPAEAPPAVVD